MNSTIFSELTSESLNNLIHLKEEGIVPMLWDSLRIALTEDEMQQVSQVTRHLRRYTLTRMNEATIWSRAIFPMLLMVEDDRIMAQAQVSLKAIFPDFELEGIADGALGSGITGVVQSPYLVVVEAKRGLESADPQYSLYGQMLAAAWKNYRSDGASSQEIYGCYTIADAWTFVHGTAIYLNEAKPQLTIQRSNELIERTEAECILEILKGITAKYIQQCHIPIARE